VKPFRLRLRRWLMVLLTLAVFCVYAMRLIKIQIVENETYKSMLDGRYISTQTIKATRGELVDREGVPLAVNRMGYDVILDKAYLPAVRQNEIILSLMELFENIGEHWTDNLPVSHSQPYTFLEGQDNEVVRLKTLLDLQEYAGADDVMHWMVQRYKLQDYPPRQQRNIAAVRYEMEQRGFTWNVTYTFATDVDIASVIQIKERSYRLPGVDIVETAVRVNPNGTLAPHIIGTIGPIYAEEYQELKDRYAMDDTIGKAGAEKAFEDMLRGVGGKREIYIGSGGEVTQVLESEPPVPGNTVMLTLDSGMQSMALESLEKQILNLQNNALPGQGQEANAGAAVVMSCKTGEILAAVTYPGYDLTTYRQDYSDLVADTALRPLVNRAIQGGYAPGSCFKPVVAVAGLTEGVVDVGSTVNCTRVYSYYQGYQPSCMGYHGHINVLGALTRSCNFYFYDVGRRLDIDNIVSYATQLGLGQPTGIEIPERVGQVSSPAAKEADPYNMEPWYPGDVLQTSIGQLYNEFSPLQLANYAATIGNRGTRMKVTLVREVRTYNMSEVIRPFEAQVAYQMQSPPEVFETVIQGMVLASRVGTASAYFGAYPLDVASKTGTPQTRDLENSTFICFAPAEDPQIAIAVVIENGWHGYTGAPVARDIMDYYFGYGVYAQLGTGN